MFIAHLPAGYLLTKRLQRKFDTKKFLTIGLIASILPDLDILYFYLIDGRQNLHHSYWIHLPFYWLLIATTVFIVIKIIKKKNYKVPTIIFFSNILLHLFLDTVVGHISWLYPLNKNSIYFFDVPAIYNFWVYNFIFHWTFSLEIGITFWAIHSYFKQKRRNAEPEYT